jgi:hypothetical protein
MSVSVLFVGREIQPAALEIGRRSSRKSEVSVNHAVRRVTTPRAKQHSDQDQRVSSSHTAQSARSRPCTQARLAAQNDLRKIGNYGISRESSVTVEEQCVAVGVVPAELARSPCGVLYVPIGKH